MKHRNVRKWADQLRRPLVMGILNVTPDSFSDGGLFVNVDSAVAHATEMLSQGADLVDVGPESTRPGAIDVDAAEQIHRSVPVIERIVQNHPNAVISIDTRLAAVAERALCAGAVMVNDISAGRDRAMVDVVRKYDAAWVLMHMQGAPSTMQDDPAYVKVVKEIKSFLVERAQAVIGAGVSPERITIDPGIGFGKTAEHNVALMRSLEAFVQTDWPVLVGVSRKRFLAALCPTAAKVEDRLGGSLACVARAIEAGVQIVRVHDVSTTRQFIDTHAAIGP